VSTLNDNALIEISDIFASNPASGPDVSRQDAATLVMRELGCVRDGRRLFTGLTRKVEAGELLRVRGDNGAGKTSLLRILCGLLQPAEGQVLWRGQALAASRETFNRELVYIGHAAALKDDLSPLENLQIACTLAGQSVSSADARRALDEAGLRSHHATPARRLSQGQRRRCALARLALPARTTAWAPLWVLDEPFNALDAAASQWLAGQVQSQLQRGGIVVLTSHQGVPLDAVPHQVLGL
jgi:heme exporter protein A